MRKIDYCDHKKEISLFHIIEIICTLLSVFLVMIILYIIYLISNTFISFYIMGWMLHG